MPRDDSAYLLDMLLAARDALSFTEGMSYDDFVSDRRTPALGSKVCGDHRRGRRARERRHEARATGHPLGGDRRIVPFPEPWMDRAQGVGVLRRSRILGLTASQVPNGDDRPRSAAVPPPNGTRRRMR